MDILGNLGKLLFGTGRQYDRDTVNKQIDQANALNQQANDYYAKNIEGVDWGGLSPDEQARRSAIMNSYNNARSQNKNGLDALGKAYEQEEKDWRYKPLGNGIIGGIINPMYQAGTAAVDLMGNTYKQNNRDPVSDIGAGVESIMNIIPGASGIKALTSAGKLVEAHWLGMPWQAQRAMWLIPIVKAVKTPSSAMLWGVYLWVQQWAQLCLSDLKSLAV